MGDLKIIETGSGGDVVLKGNDLQTINGLQNMPLLALFGGNPGAPTTGPSEDGEESFDWWGNYVLNPNRPAVWFNSYLENLLNNISITPIVLDKINQTVKKDLRFLSDFATIEVTSSIPYVDTLKINITITELSSGEENEFTYIWNATESELTGNGVVSSDSGSGVGLPNTLIFDL